ncbi:MAG: AAA family ATPase [Dehalococcoidales bacterium]|nr:AAA family ATPase [Dehalococcoidales bacterium]
MTISIAVAGKGGSGKTSLTALVIRYLLKKRLTPVLAVDADPNANLGESLGIETGKTIGLILDEFQKEKIQIPQGMAKEHYLEFKLNEAITEAKGLDLLTMGKGEGAECYCYPNLMLRKFIDQLSGNYAYVVIDNEAGMEHLSRRTTQNIDEMLLISNHSVRGVRTIARLSSLIEELRLSVKRQSVIISQVPEVLDPLISAELARLEIKPTAIVPQDQTIYEYDLKMKPLLDLPDSAPAAKAVDALMDALLKEKQQ